MPRMPWHTQWKWSAALALVGAGLAPIVFAAKLPPDYPLAFRCQGQGTPAERIVACDRIIAAGGVSLLTPAQAYGLRADALAEMNQYTDAIADYDRAIALDPRDPTAHFNRGLAYAALGDDAHAVADFDEQIRLQPQYYDAFYHRGLIWTRKHEFDLAIRDFDEVIRLYHSFGDEVCCRYTLMTALYRRGLARLDRGDLDRAIDDFSGAIAINPTADFYASRSEAYDRAGDHAAALKDTMMATALAGRGYTYKER
jgi:tetratricopeptide (TPR) repeat protein